MITFKESKKVYNNIANVDKMPFEFNGKSTYDHPVFLNLKVCGCTDLKNNMIVLPNSEFNIKANLDKRSELGSHRKVIGITVYKTEEDRKVQKNHIQKLNIEFTMNLVKA